MHLFALRQSDLGVELFDKRINRVSLALVARLISKKILAT